ncbi:MAG: XdhC family protein [Chitinophagaceae bacterium]
MKEIEDIIAAYDVAVIAGKKTALATVVHVDGSSYRRPGARMLITEDGMLTGAISGGCLEGDALRKSLLVIMQQQPLLVTYDTSDEEDAVIGMGLGCNGIIQVLIEPIDTNNKLNPIQLLKQVVAQKQKAVLVTLFNLADKRAAQPGTCLLLGEEGIIKGTDIPLQDMLLKAAKSVLISEQSSFHQYTREEWQFTAFTEFIPPAISLVIIGAGNDVFPLVNMAGILGWQTTVIDGRPAYAKKERFPAACSVILAKPEEAVKVLPVNDRTAIVLMTHNYNYDLAMMEALADKKVGYIGVLGPKKKLDRMMAELTTKGIVFTDEQCAVVHGPVGLDIGAETAEEIALSILAEIKTVFAHAQAHSLKNSNAPIHNRSALVIEQVQLPGN